LSNLLKLINLTRAIKNNHKINNLNKIELIKIINNNNKDHKYLKIDQILLGEERTLRLLRM